jgi:hypothetical protein
VAPKASEAERWLAELGHPQEDALRRIREIILGADPRMAEVVQYRTLHFVYEGDLASFVQLAKKPVTLMFNVGARIPGRFPHLEGDGPNARFMRFANLAEVNARAAELRRIVDAWCAYKSPPRKER